MNACTPARLVLLMMLLIAPCRVLAQPLPDVLDHLPADAELAIVVPSMAGLSDQAAALETAAGLRAGELQDVLGIFKRELGVVSGLDDNGSMMLALSGVGEALAAGRAPRAYLLLPVADYNALLQSLSGTAGDTSPITLPGGYTGVMRQAGNHALIAMDTEALSAYRPGGRSAKLLADAGGAGQQVVAQSGLSVLLDAAATRNVIAGPLTDATLAVLEHVNPLLAYDLEPEAWRPLISSLDRTWVQGTDHAVVGLTLGDQGVSITKSYKPVVGTDLAALLPGRPRATGTDAALAALTAKPVVFAFAADAGAVDVSHLADRLGAVVGLDAEHALGPVREPLSELFKGVDTVAAAYYALPQRPDQLVSHWFNTAAVLTGPDPKAVAAQAKAFLTKLNGMALPLADGGSVTLVALYKANVREVDGHTIDTFTVRMAVPPTALDTPVAHAVAAVAAGGFTGQVVTTDKHVLITTTDDDPATLALLAALQRGDGLGANDRIGQLRGPQLPGRNALQAYFSFRGIAESLNPFLQMIGGVEAIRVPADLPPIGVSIQTDNGQVVGTVHVPAAVIGLLKDEGFDLEPRQQTGRP